MASKWKVCRFEFDSAINSNDRRHEKEEEDQNVDFIYYCDDDDDINDDDINDDDINNDDDNITDDDARTVTINFVETFFASSDDRKNENEEATALNFVELCHNDNHLPTYQKEPLTNSPIRQKTALCNCLRHGSL